jgi:hypothetical protein
MANARTARLPNAGASARSKDGVSLKVSLKTFVQKRAGSGRDARGTRGRAMLGLPSTTKIYIISLVVTVDLG